MKEVTEDKKKSNYSAMMVDFLTYKAMTTWHFVRVRVSSNGSIDVELEVFFGVNMNLY